MICNGFFCCLEDVSSSPLTCVCFLTETEVLCCNALSQMKLWDLRVNKSDVAANINNFTQVKLILTFYLLLYNVCFNITY